MAVVLILVVLWVVVLTPAVVRRLREHSSSESIDSFHHSLHLLERTGPKLIPPAYRLESAFASQGLATGQSGYPSVSSAPGRPNLVLLKPDDGSEGDRPDDQVVDEVSGEHYQRVELPPLVETGPEHPWLAQRSEDYRRQQGRRRRREVVAGLTATFLVTGLLGIAHQFRLLWVLTALSGLVLAAYVALSLYARSLSAPARVRPSRPASARRIADPEPPQPVLYPGREVAQRRALAVAGFPGAWDDLEDDETDGAWPSAAERWEAEIDHFQPKVAGAR